MIYEFSKTVGYKINIPNPQFLVEKNSIHYRSKHQKIPKRNPDVDNSSLGDPYILAAVLPEWFGLCCY